MTARRCTALAAALAALVVPAAAQADGDPASDVLLGRDAYLPYAPPPSNALADTLLRLLEQARRRGYPMKVALIQTRGDLGAYPELFAHPDRYVRLLRREIAFRVRHPHLLVIMARGGAAGSNLGDGAGVVGEIAPDPAQRSDGLVRAAIDAVARIAAANGHQLDVQAARHADPAAAASGEEGGRWRPWAYAGSGLAVLAGLVLVGLSLLRPLGRSRRPGRQRP